MITDLKQLWQEAFSEPGDQFFAVGFSRERYCCLYTRDQLAGAVYWFDVTCEGKKYAYIYGLATAKNLRNQGYGKRLMHQTQEQLRRCGYDGIILVPADKGLFDYYAKMGYENLCGVEEFSCDAQGGLPIRSVQPEEYAHLRKDLLPKGGVLQEGKLLRYLASYASFWAGDGWLLCGYIMNDTLYVQEFLGDRTLASAITAAVGAKKGCFRIPGTGRPFAMYYSLNSGEKPNYFGIAMD